LSEEEVKELIPLLGERKKFQVALLSLKLSNTIDSDITLVKNINLLNLPLPEDLEVAKVRFIFYILIFLYKNFFKVLYVI